MSHNAEESEDSPKSPHLGEIKHMRKQCVPGAPPFLACARDEATLNLRWDYCQTIMKPAMVKLYVHHCQQFIIQSSDSF